MKIRKAEQKDISRVAEIYKSVIAECESGRMKTGWIRDIYPTADTAEAALKRGDLFVLEDSGDIAATAIINQIQVDVYEQGAWEHETPGDGVCVMHTLAVDPAKTGRGFGGSFLNFYESYAKENGLCELRIDTNEKNTPAREIYAKLGYKEVGTVPTSFNGIPEVRLVLLEKNIGK